MIKEAIVYTIIFILLLVIVLLVWLVVVRKDLVQKYYKGYKRVSHKDSLRKINVEATEDDLRRAFYAQLVEESEEESGKFCMEDKLCHKYCKEEVCHDYRDQKINYDYCLDCEKNNLCWNELNGACQICNENNIKNCNDKYGCNGEVLKNPARNFCKKCWKTE
jgi:hypothetical protein